MSINLEPDFDYQSLPEGSKGLYQLAVSASEEFASLVEDVFLASSDLADRESILAEIQSFHTNGHLSIPVLTARGSNDGPTLVVSAGVHGDEYEGTEAIYRLFESLLPHQMRGTVIALPLVTPPAFWLGTRLNPVDLRNMARVFPGAANGTLSQRLAGELLERVLRHADLYVDLHSSGRNYHMLTLCGYVLSGTQAERAEEAAFHFGAPVIWAHPDCSPGRTISATLAQGIPSLYTEAYGGGHARSEDIECYARGLANLLKLLRIADLPLAGLPGNWQPRRLYGSGDSDFGIRCPHNGLFFPTVKLDARIRAGESVGILRDVRGNRLDEIRSSASGVVVMIRATPRIYGGELIAVLAEEA